MSEFTWVEIYRPQKIKDCILPASIKKTFKDFVKKGEIQNMLLSGPPGIGKTTVAKTLCIELGVDYLVINGSDEGRFLDTVRNKAKNFASTVSLTSNANHKVIIIDEADNTGHDVQMSLRAFIEEFSNNCRFIFTCNYKNKIIPPIHSRCSVIDFNIRGKEKAKLATTFFKRLISILEKEKIEFEEKVVAAFIEKYFPDWRRVLNECQRYSLGGKIDSGILTMISDVKTDNLVEYIKQKKFSEMRKWVADNIDNDGVQLMRHIFDALLPFLEGRSIASSLLILADYQYKAAFAVDQEINVSSFLTEIMTECEFK